MKPLVILARITFVGLIWSIFFIEGIRVMLLINWHFDIFNGRHWEIAYELWMSGWTIKHAKEWAFVLIIISFIPLWLTGWAALSLVAWEKIIKQLADRPLAFFSGFLNKPVAAIKSSAQVKAVKPKKSYKEVRPRATRVVDDYNDAAPAPIFNPPPSAVSPASKPAVLAPARPSVAPPPAAAKPQAASDFDHSLFKFDDEEDFSFDFDAYDEKEEEKEPAAEIYSPKKEAPKSTQASVSKDKERNKNNSKQNKNQNLNQKSAPAPKAGGSSVADIIKQKGYDVITGTLINDITIDYIAVSNKDVLLFIVDKEPGDWLADEERFNDEEPLWFSESSHRISPVRKVDIVRSILNGQLKDNNLKFNVKGNVVIALGNIINAEDMLEVWDDMNVSVTRIDRGSPKELKLFAKHLPEAIDSIAKDKLEKLKKVIRNIK